MLRSYQVSGGEILYILERPGALAILVLMIFSMGFTAISQRKRKAKLAAAQP
jgi:putative tricarboxylic transport membrane protein